MLNEGKLILKKKLINSIWGDYTKNPVNDNTINVTISKIRKKMGKSFNLETRINEGYILKKN